MSKILHHQFLKIANKYGHKIAISDQATGRNVSYKQLLILSIALSKKIKKIKSNYVGTMLPTSAAGICANLATLMSGKIPVFINYSTGVNENCKITIERCQTNCIITSKKLLEKISCSPISEMIFMEDLVHQLTIFEKIIALLKSKFSEYFIHKAQEDDIAAILFTSGSVAAPKLVQLSHKNLSSNLEGISKAFNFTNHDRFMAILPLFHVFGLNVNCWVPLSVGASIITYANPLDYAGVVNTIEKYRPTILASPPVFLYGYLKKASSTTFDSLTTIVAGADKLPEDLRIEFLNKHRKTIYEGYGTTETSPVISVNTPNNNRPGSIGKSLFNVSVKVANIETFEELPNNCEGRILVKGDSIMQGYLNDSEATNHVMHNGFYDTGDIGVLDADGYLWHRGRSKRFIKIGGEMISLLMVESAIQLVVGNEIQICAVGIPHQTKGSEIAIAYYGPLNVEKIAKRLTNHLPNIAIPKYFKNFDSELPVTGTGKIDFKKIEHILRNSHWPT